MHIANKRMGYLRATYCLFRDTVSGTEKDNIALMKLHRKVCIKQYHALIPQLDLMETQWGVKIGDTLLCNNFGTPPKRTPQKSASKKKLKAALATKTRAQLTAKTTGSMSRTDGSVGVAKTAEEGSLIQPEPDPSGSCGGHAGVESPKMKGRFDQQSPDMHTDELHVSPALQPVHDVGRGNDGKVNDLASLSFGSGTEYLAETYVLINSERKVFFLVFTSTSWPGNNHSR
jgi:hypothetical protein